MEKVLIRRDSDLIAEDQAQLESTALTLKAIYSGFEAIGLTTVSLPEMVNLLRQSLRIEKTQATVSSLDNHPNRVASQNFGVVAQEAQRSVFLPFLEELVKDKLMLLAGTANFGGVALKGEKLRDLLELPALAGIEENLLEFKNKQELLNDRLRKTTPDATAFKLEAGAVTVLQEAYAAVEAKHSHYAQTEKGVKTYRTLAALCKALSDYKDMTGNTMEKLRDGSWSKTILEGVDVDAGGYVPSLHFIRQREG